MIVVFVLLFNVFPVSAMASDAQIGPVEIDLLPSASLESRFRIWAARVIDEYYSDYCMHESDSVSKYCDYQFDHINNSSGQYSGIFREYYFAAGAKYEYDYHKQETYTIIRYDDETYQQYEERMLPFYKMLLIESMEEKYVIDDTAYDSLTPSEAGLYVLQEVDGMLKMVKDPSGTMQGLEEMANAGAIQAWSMFVLEAVNMIIKAADTYTTLQTGGAMDDGTKFVMKIKEAAIKGITEVIKTGIKAFFGNEINKLQNNMNEAMICYISNKELVNYNRIMCYLDSVYSDSAFREFRTDSVFRRAVNELKELAAIKHDDSSSAIAEWYSQSCTTKPELSDYDILIMVGEELGEQLVEIFAAAFDEACSSIRNYSDLEAEVGTIMMDCLNCVFSIVKSIVKSAIKTQIDARMEGDSDAKLEWEKAIRDAAQEGLSTMTKSLRGINESTLSTIDKGSVTGVIIVSILSFLIKNTKNIQDLSVSLKSGIFTKEQQDTIIDMCSSVIGELLKGGATIVKKELKQAGSNFFKEHAIVSDLIQAISSLWDSMMKTSKKLAEAVSATMDALTDEKQTSYKAVMICSAYVASLPIEMELNVTLSNVKKKNGGVLYDAILDPESVLNGRITCADILNWTDKILLQLEYDISGTKWLCNLLGTGEAYSEGWWSPEYYKFVIKCAKLHSEWKTRMTNEVATDEYNQMVNYRTAWLADWDEAFRTLQ